MISNDKIDELIGVDEIEEQIEIFLDAYKRDFVSSNQIAKFLGIADLIKNRKIAKKIKYIMDNENEWVYTNILTLASGEKVTMSDDEYKSMITSSLDEMLGDMFPESRVK